jgi:hypothetical protein
MIPPIPAAIFNVNGEDAAWVDTMSTAQPLATFVQGVRTGVESNAVANRHIRLRDRERGRLVRLDSYTTEGASAVEDAYDRVRAQHHARPPPGIGLATAGRSGLVRT